MTSRKIFEILHRLTSQQLRKLDDFLHSPYYNKQTIILVLWKYLKPLTANFPALKIKDEQVFKAVFPKKSFSSKQLNYLYSNLLELTSQFLALEVQERKQDS